MDKEARKAAKIMLIRHAEKPSGRDAYGVTKKGKHEKKSLSVRGWQRAGALANLFAPANGCFQHPALAAPDFLFASKPVKHNGSRRPFETVLPLADKLGIEINADFEKFEFEAMLAEAIERRGVVLICWQKEFLPEIAKLILREEMPAAAMPEAWTEDRFDLIWLFDKEFGSEAFCFRQISQNLLAGDLPNLPI